MSESPVAEPNVDRSEVEPPAMKALPDVEFVRRLPYHFARANGVIAARATPEWAEIWVRPDIAAATLGEVRRVLGLPLRPVVVPEETFALRLAQAYTQEESGAASLIDDINGATDLRSLADGLPEITDLLEAEDDAPIIRLINALLTQALREGPPTSTSKRSRPARWCASASTARCAMSSNRRARCTQRSCRA